MITDITGNQIIKTFKIKNYKIVFITEVNEMHYDTWIQQHNIMFMIKKLIIHSIELWIGNN